MAKALEHLLPLKLRSSFRVCEVCEPLHRHKRGFPPPPGAGLSNEDAAVHNTRGLCLREAQSEELNNHAKTTSQP